MKLDSYKNLEEEVRNELENYKEGNENDFEENLNDTNLLKIKDSTSNNIEKKNVN